MKKLFYIFKVATLLVLVIMLSSCQRKVKIETNDIDKVLDTSMFRGVVSDLTYDELCDLVGEPQDFWDKKATSFDDEEDHNPVYYFDNGKLMCYWSGSKKTTMGVITFTPYLNRPMNINEILKVNIVDYNITKDTKSVCIYKGKIECYCIDLDNLRVKDISCMMDKND